MAGSPQQVETQIQGRFYAHARDEGRHVDHLVPAAIDAQDAALRFAEHWLPTAATAGAHQVSIIVRDGDSGREQCFMIDLDSGDAEPCA